jgi:hypothetical protein
VSLLHTFILFGFHHSAKVPSLRLNVLRIRFFSFNYSFFLFFTLIAAKELNEQEDYKRNNYKKLITAAINTPYLILIDLALQVFNIGSLECGIK